MNESIRTTKINMDSSALRRLMEAAREKGIYSNRGEAQRDNYETAVKRLCDEFQRGDE